MIILIDGFWGSGKTVLRSLLDGHKDLYVSPSQESILSTFFRNQNKFDFFEYKDIRLIRELLIESYYYNLEHESINGYLDSDLKKEKKNFNFYEFENFWVSQLVKKKNWNYKSVLEVIYSSIIQFFYDLPETPYQKKKVFVEDNSFESHEFFLNTFEDSKLIIVKKDIPNTIASLVNREVNERDYKSEGYKKFDFDHLVRKLNFPLKIRNNYEISDKLIEKFSQRVLLTKFENLIFHTEEEMIKISNFLNIDFENILLEPTHFGEKILFNDSHLVIKKQKHEAKEIFSNYENNLLNHFTNKKLYKNYFSLTFLEYIFIMFKYYIKVFFRIIKKNDK